MKPLTCSVSFFSPFVSCITPGCPHGSLGVFQHLCYLHVENSCVPMKLFAVFLFFRIVPSYAIISKLLLLPLRDLNISILTLLFSPCRIVAYTTLYIYFLLSYDFIFFFPFAVLFVVFRSYLKTYFKICVLASYFHSLIYKLPHCVFPYTSFHFYFSRCLTECLRTWNLELTSMNQISSNSPIAILLNHPKPHFLHLLNLDNT